MRMDELKRGFWGYQKDSVYHYIVSLEEKASERVAEKEAKLEKLEEEMKRQTAELEATVAALRAENASLRENQAAVFSTMLEAQRYADQIRADSDRQKKQSQEQLSAAVQQKNRQLGGYAEQIQQLRAAIQDLLKDFDGRLADAERALARLSVQAPLAGLDGEELSGKGGFGAGRPSAVPGREAFPAKPDQEEGGEWKRISLP